MASDSLTGYTKYAQQNYRRKPNGQLWDVKADKPVTKSHKTNIKSQLKSDFNKAKTSRQIKNREWLKLNVAPLGKLLPFESLANEADRFVKGFQTSTELTADGKPQSAAQYEKDLQIKNRIDKAQRDNLAIQDEAFKAQAYGMAKSNTGEVQFPNLRPKASELAIQNQEITTPLPQAGTVAGIVRGSDQDYGTNPDGSVRGQPRAAETLDLQKKNREQPKTNTGNFDTLSVDELKKRIRSGGRNSVMKNKMKLALMNKNIAKIQHMAEMGGDG